MKTSFFVAIAAALFGVADANTNITKGRGSPGCGKSIDKTDITELTAQFNVDGINRVFKTYTPHQYDKNTPQPLILAFHGTGKGPQVMTLQNRFSDRFVNRNMMVQYMIAYKSRWYGPKNAHAEADDFRYTEMVLEYLMNNYCIDVDRVYLLGHTGGAGFANILACDPRFSRHFAGMALMAPTLYRDLDDDYCKHANVPMPMFEVHGTKDAYSPYWGVKGRVVDAIASTPEWIRRWVRRNGCDPLPRQTKLVRDWQVLSDKYTCGGQYGFVEHVRAIGLRYNWMTAHDIFDISPVMMNFLNSHIRQSNMSIPLDDTGNFTCLGGYTPPADWPGHGKSTALAKSFGSEAPNATAHNSTAQTSTIRSSKTHSSTAHNSATHSSIAHNTHSSTRTIPGGTTSSTDSVHPGYSGETPTGSFDKLAITERATSVEEAGARSH